MIHGKAAFLISDETDETTLPFRIAEGRTHHEILSNEINALKLTRKVKILQTGTLQSMSVNCWLYLYMRST